jgi:site-specific DNA-methyltransferase (adenine-specific)
MGIMNVHFSSISNEWATPVEVFDKINMVYVGYGPFTLDPCCTPKTAKAKKYFTQADNGLRKDWTGHTVWVNPPYGREIGKWVEKSYQESLKGNKVVMLIPSRTDTRWWHEYCMKAERIVFFKGRIKFVRAGKKKESAPFPSCLVIFSGKSIDRAPIFDTMEA